MELTSLVANVLELDPAELTDERQLASYGNWSSLRQVQLVVAVESAYGLKFALREIRVMKTVGDIRRILDQAKTP